MEIIKSRQLLERWINSAKNDLFSPEDRPDLMVYGTGTTTWGAQTHQKGFAAIAVLAADSDTDHKITGFSKEELIDIACKLLRFTLESHYQGSYHCMASEDEKWGHHWLSSLGIERMMPGIDAIWQYLTDSDKTLLEKVLISEAEWLLNEQQIVADLVNPNKPEVNIWSGAFLHRVAMMYPHCANKKKYEERGTKFLLNGICLPLDAESGELFEGKPISEWNVGANFFESYALFHHHYLNVGYMVICLSNIALFHFECKRRGKKAPKALYRNAEKLWQLVRSFIFPDGRLLRAGGDTRVRYCYCQDYLLPALHFVQDAFSEDVSKLIDGWVNIVEKELESNGDNSFLSDRCELLKERSTLYYTRLESDRACCLAYDAYYKRMFSGSKPFGTGGYIVDNTFKETINLWKDEFTGAAFARNKEHFISFCWKGGEAPVGLCLPLSDSSMAEWKNNMTSVFEGDGLSNHYKPIWHKTQLYQKSFITIGEYQSQTEELLEENANKADTVKNTIVFAALPDGQTAVTLQYAYAPNRIHLLNVKGLNLLIPNDIFNDNKRQYFCGDNFINIDNKLTAKSIYGEKVKLYKAKTRQIGLKYVGKLYNSIVFRDRGHLKCDEICTDYSSEPKWYNKNQTIADFAVAVVSGVSAEDSKDIKVQNIFADNKDARLRGVKVQGRDNKAYFVIANVSDEKVKLNIESLGSISLEPKSAEIIECK